MSKNAQNINIDITYLSNSLTGLQQASRPVAVPSGNLHTKTFTQH